MYKNRNILIFPRKSTRSRTYFHSILAASTAARRSSPTTMVLVIDSSVVGECRLGEADEQQQRFICKLILLPHATKLIAKFTQIPNAGSWQSGPKHLKTYAAYTVNTPDLIWNAPRNAASDLIARWRYD